MTRRPISCSRINTSPLHDYVRLVRLNKGPVCNASLLNVCGSMLNTYSLRQDTLFPVHSSQPDTHRESSQWSQSQTSGQTPGHFQHQKSCVRYLPGWTVQPYGMCSFPGAAISILDQWTFLPKHFCHLFFSIEF